MSGQGIRRVETGMWAKVRGSQLGHDAFEEVFHFVSSEQVNLAQNRVSIKGPLGRVLSGAKAGDKAQLETDKGTIDLMVLELGRG